MASETVVLCWECSREVRSYITATMKVGFGGELLAEVEHRCDCGFGWSSVRQLIDGRATMPDGTQIRTIPESVQA